MSLTLSNALLRAPLAACCLAQDTRAAGPTAATTQGAAGSAPSTWMIGLAAVGAVVLVIYVTRRLVYPAKLHLTQASGRRSRLHPIHAVALYLFYVLAQAVAIKLLGAWLPAKSDELLTLAAVISQTLWLAAALLVAWMAFDMGLVRGMGLSMRHWFFDAIRGVVAYLAVLPVCLGLTRLTQLLIPGEEHRMLRALHQVGAGWQALIIVSAVVLAPLAEEVFFRGLLQSTFRKYLRRPWAAILLTSAFFALVHAAYPTSMPAMFALSVALGYNYERCGRLPAPILIHALFNGVFIIETLRAAG
ncbi:MAG TPA: CPBP family intramembrane glutamic endopeptidase [Phycisphaerae bacterium]|nr:CPBP family intramembrane glutamic endopeptidase [Phycisphaerae bacterium]